MSYQIKQLEQLCHIAIGRTPARKEPAYWGQGNKWVSISDLTSKVICDTKEEITDHAVKKTRCKKVSKGTLLFSFKLTIGKMAFAGCDLYTNEAIAALHIKDKNELYGEYLFYALGVTNFLGSNQAAMGKTLNSKSLAKIEIPLPPLDDQKRIAHLLGKVEGLIARRKQHLQQLDDLLKSIFLKMFGDPVRNEKGWNTKSFDKIGKFISGGTPSKKREDYWEGSFPWVSPKDMKRHDINDAQDHISEIVFKETSLKRIPPHHLLIVVRGMILAHSFPVAINNVEVAINQDMKAIKPIEGLHVVFLMHCLDAQKRQILKLISTAGHGTKKFDSNSMQKLLIPTPPPELQDQFVTVAMKIDDIKARYQQSLMDLENLYNALSQKAFKRELDLSRIILPDEQQDITAEEYQSQQIPEDDPILQFLELSTPDLNVLEALGTPEKRKLTLEQWLIEYVDQIRVGECISTQQFMDAALNKLIELDQDGLFEEWEQEGEPELTVEDYEIIKTMIFKMLEDGSLLQKFDDDKNTIKVVPA